MIDEERRVFDRMLVNKDHIWGDQDAFREALWRFSVQKGVVKDQEATKNIVCRWPAAQKGIKDECLVRHHKEQEQFVEPLDRKMHCWHHCLGDRRLDHNAHSDRWFDDSAACGKKKSLRLAICDWHSEDD